MSPVEQDADGSVPALGADAAERREAAAERRARDRSVMAVVEGMSDAFLSLDRDWRITYANREAARLNGTTASALVGRDHWTVWPETAGTEVERQYRRAVAEGVPVTFEHHYPAADVWHEIRAYPAEEGGLAVFYRDVTARKRLEAERARQAQELAAAHDKAMAAETQFRLLVDRVRDYAIFLMDPDGTVTHWGAGAERMTGWRAEAMVGQSVQRLYPADGGEDGRAEDHLRHAALHGEYTGEGTRVRHDGGAFAARVVLTALREGGRLVGFSMIAQDLTGERERAAALERAMAVAVAASTAKSQFLANTSHEIRTPLNAIIGYAELLELGLGGPLTEAQQGYVARIQATSRHLLALVNDVLDLAKIEAGQMHTAREPALLRDAVAAALQLVEPQARARRIVLVNACTAQSITAYCGDAARVRQVLANLLSNAVRFTEVGGRVTVTCGEADAAPPEAAVAHAGVPGTWAFVRVEDTGVGIAPEQLDRIWEAFVQADQGRTRRVGGSGLGLTISRHLARLMGGDITVRSQPGLGSSFMLWLPAADAEAVARARSAGPGATHDDAAAERTRRLSAARDAAGLHAVADALLGETERVLARYVAALRRESQTPSAHALGDAQLLDHTATFLADLAQALTVIGDDGPDAAQMLRDGSTIQQLIAARHGAQRARLGWSEAEVRRDYEVLRDTVHETVRRLAPAAPDVERALGIVDHLLARAVDDSLHAFRQPR